MRFLLGVFVGYNLRGRNNLLFTVLALVVLIEYVIVPTGALLALHLDVQRERHSRPARTNVPSIKGLSYQDAETKLHASNEHSIIGDPLRSTTSARTGYRAGSTT